MCATELEIPWRISSGDFLRGHDYLLPRLSRSVLEKQRLNFVVEFKYLLEPFARFAVTHLRSRRVHRAAWTLGHRD